MNQREGFVKSYLALTIGNDGSMRDLGMERPIVDGLVGVIILMKGGERGASWWK